MIFRPSLIPVFRLTTIGSLCLLVLMAGIRGCMSASAQGQLNDALAVVKQEQDVVNAKVAQLEAARQNHLRMYLKDISLDGATKEMGAIQALCTKAGQADEPSTKAALAAEARDRANRLKDSFGDFTSYLQELDNAKAQYVSATTLLHQRGVGARAQISRLIQAGYFQNHFTEAYKALDAGDQLYALAAASLNKKVEGDSPDYLGIYRTDNQGLGSVASALEMANAVPAQRTQTASQIDETTTTLPSVQEKYGRAYAAATQLEQYPRYRRLATIQHKNDALSRVPSLVAEARRCNGMDIQDFTGGARAIGEAQQIIEEASAYFDSTVNVLESIRSALRSLSSARSSAEHAIRRAKNEIDSYSQNDQSDAESTLSSARSSLRQGSSEVDSDPIASLSSYENAKRQADQAYDEVDTADHSYHPSTSDDSSSNSYGGSSNSYGGSSGGYGGSSGGYGGGSSSYGGGGLGGSSPSSGSSSYGHGGLGD
jgi:hypothetical protein